MRTFDQSRVIDEAHYSGLMSSMSHARNRLLFFVLFLTYCFLGVISTTDKMLYLETPITMPLLNIDLPLLGFYYVMPVFIVVLHFNLLYTFLAYRQFLKNSKNHHPLSLKHFTMGLYEGLLLTDGKWWYQGLIRFVLGGLFYLFPIFVLASFWFRFADYQSPAMSAWHLLTIFLSAGVSLFFKGLLAFETIRNKRRFIFMPVLLLVLSYHALIIFPVSRSTVDFKVLQQLEKFNEKIDVFFKDSLKRVHWFLPQITLYGEVLVPLDKYQLEIMQDADKKKQPLLTYVLAQNKQRRNFRLAIFEGCILINTNFSDAQFQGARLWKANLQGADLRLANLQGADLKEANLQGAILWFANLQGAGLSEANFQGANLTGANLQGVYSKWYANFSNQKGKSADITGISKEVLTAEKVEIIMGELQPLISNEDKLKEIRARLEKAVGKDPVEWVKNQLGINLGMLTEADYDKIDKSITNSEVMEIIELSISIPSPNI